MTVEACDGVISAFRHDFRVVVVELPNFGFSRTSSAKSAAFVGAVLTIEEALKALNLKACILFGPCICGFVAGELVHRGQLPARGIVLLQTPDKEGMLSWVDRMDPKGIKRTLLLGQIVVRLFAKRIAKFWVKYAGARGFDSEDLFRTCVAALESGGGYPLATMLQRWGQGTADAHLNVPGLGLWGMQDRSHNGTEPTSTRQHLPTVEIIEFTDCGHFAELEQPDRFAAVVVPLVQACFSGCSWKLDSGRNH